MLPRRLASVLFIPQLCFGDFNETLNLNEKLGGKDKNSSMLDEFREAFVNDHNLVDLRCKFYSLTQSSKRFKPYFIKEQLDRFLGNKEEKNNPFELIVSNINTWSSGNSLVIRNA